jgi:hypothetical protein
MDQRKRAAAGRKVIENCGDQFMTPADKSLHKKTDFANKFGIAVMLLSFPLSFHFSKRIASDKARAGKYLMQNFGMSASACLFFGYSAWNKGKVEEQLANKYFANTSDHELEHFELNKAINIQKIQSFLNQPNHYQNQYPQ